MSVDRLSATVRGCRVRPGAGPGEGVDGVVAVVPRLGEEELEVVRAVRDAMGVCVVAVTGDDAASPPPPPPAEPGVVVCTPATVNAVVGELWVDRGRWVADARRADADRLERVRIAVRIDGERACRDVARAWVEGRCADPDAVMAAALRRTVLAHGVAVPPLPAPGGGACGGVGAGRGGADGAGRGGADGGGGGGGGGGGAADGAGGGAGGATGAGASAGHGAAGAEGPSPLTGAVVTGTGAMAGGVASGAAVLRAGAPVWAAVVVGLVVTGAVAGVRWWMDRQRAAARRRAPEVAAWRERWSAQIAACVVQLRVPRVADAVAAGWPAAGTGHGVGTGDREGPGEAQGTRETQGTGHDVGTGGREGPGETQMRDRTQEQAPDQARTDTETETEEAVGRG
ncbi:hypothetical protein MTQ24_02080 [Corynebacterium bovis]|uniref:hypothetical protein n=1 Tax=Corynebacterium bovis TaxID=36808 RepID=UPI003138A284